MPVLVAQEKNTRIVTELVNKKRASIWGLFFFGLNNNMILKQYAISSVHFSDCSFALFFRTKHEYRYLDPRYRVETGFSLFQ